MVHIKCLGRIQIVPPPPCTDYDVIVTTYLTICLGILVVTLRQIKPNLLAGPGSNFHRLYRIVPVRDMYHLDLHWSLPSLLKKYRTDPLGYISHIVGYEGKGSLTSYLRNKVWALSLAAGCAEDGFEMNQVGSNTRTNLFGREN